MSDEIRVTGIDPSFSNFGYAHGTLNMETGVLTNLQVELRESPPVKAKKQVRQNSKDLERAQIQFEGLSNICKQSDMVFVEIPVGSQSARAMASYGVCIGLLASIQIPMIQVTPTEVKVAATNKKTASKKEMIEWATQAYPDAGWLTKKVKGIVSFTDKNEHPADALAAIYAGVKTEQFQQLLAMRKKLKGFTL
tara:strand:- start:48402 stop:48983 length:582 start_codon:yes stop_codon:yes gene_type:complete